jgi:protein-disulfide isomerase-like protein with CxxC motif
MEQAERVEVVEYTDVMCSWAWGSEPKLRLLRWRYEDRCDWRLVMGGLVGDRTKHPAWDPVAPVPKTIAFWAQVASHTGAPYPVHLQWVPSCSDASGIGLCAARLQGDAVALAVLRRLREALFVFGCPPDTLARVLDAVQGTPGLDMERFVRDLHRPEARAAYCADWEETRKPNAYVRALQGDWPGIGNLKQTDGLERYAFPTLLFRGPGGEHTVPGWCALAAYLEAMEQAVPGSTSVPRPDPTPNESFAHWPLLTATELAILCGPDAEPPSGATTYDWGDGVVYLRPDLYPALRQGRGDGTSQEG